MKLLKLIYIIVIPLQASHLPLVLFTYSSSSSPCPTNLLPHTYSLSSPTTNTLPTNPPSFKLVVIALPLKGLSVKKKSYK